MALADLAVEMLYIISVLTLLGHIFTAGSVDAETSDPEAHRMLHAVGDTVKQGEAAVGDFEHGPVEVGVDNKGAYDLCHRTTAGKNSRHVDRKLFKMRGLRGAGVVRVRHIPGETNPADMFTKILTRQPFEKHRKFVMNLPGNDGVEKTRAAVAWAASSQRDGISVP